QTPTLSTVNIQTTIVNSSDSAQKVIVSSCVGDNKTNSTETIPANSERLFSQTLKVPNAKTWSSEEPNLYSVETEVTVAGKKVDQYTTPLGFRTIKFDPKKGLFINGKTTKLKGVCLHEDGGGAVGTAVPVDVWERRFKILKEMGCNAVRCSHNPFFTEFYDLADRMGLYVIDEAFDEWRVGKREYTYSKHFDKWAERDLSDMIRRDRNHPSIICWSTGNEIRDVHEKHGEKTVKFLVKTCKSLDSRPTTIGLNHFETANEYGITDALDWVGYNFAHRGDKYGTEHAKFPKRKIYGSETTHSFQTRGIYRTRTLRNNTALQPNITPKEIFTKFNFAYQSSYDNAFIEHHNRYSLANMRDTEWLAGEFRWTGIDYLGESGPWPARFKNFGIIDMCGYPKDTYYLYQSAWSDNTVLHVLPHWTWQGMEGTEIPVWVYANQCDEVELIVNGKSLGKKTYNYKELYASWDVPYAPGEVRAISYLKGAKVKETVIKTAGEAASIELVIDKDLISPNHRDIVHAQVRILDKDGNFVPYANDRVSFSVDGPATILGVDNGDQLDHDDLKSPSRKVFNGMCLAIIQSEFKEGTVTIKAESPKLKGASCQFSIEGKRPEFAHSYTTPENMSYTVSKLELGLNLPDQKELDRLKKARDNSGGKKKKKKKNKNKKKAKH
ncbi:MAG: DUF4982 domain-containing protein, partial [Planctomycetes bacterium]|nr:DUF4982 domain-containing protein [Planctomycetota bacterium]